MASLNTPNGNASPFLIPGLEFFSDPKANTRPGNLYTEKLNADFHNDPKSGYHIPFVPIGVSENRRLKVVTIGAGLCGIMLAYNIEKHTPNVEHVIYEKNPEVGGTWYQNRYPMAGCDSPTCTYQFNFAISPDWEDFYSSSDYLRRYINKVVDKLDLKKYIIFKSRVIEARFNEERGTWDLKIEQTLADGTKKIVTDDCDLLLGAVGILDRWELPKIPGLDTFKGRVIHSADRTQWGEYTKDKWGKDNIAVIGSGASSIQAVPGMQPHAKKLDVFVRTPPWFFAQPDNIKGETRPQGYKCESPLKILRCCAADDILGKDTDEERDVFQKDHKAMLKHSKANENTLMMLHHLMVKHNPLHHQAREQITKRTREWIKDDEIFAKIIPDFSVGCRRIAPGDPYMLAIQKPNVEMHFCGVAKVVEYGVIGDDGKRSACDTIVCATGFDVSYRPPFPLIGLGGVDLRKEWTDVPASYLGVMAPRIPNYLMYLGPNSPVESGSITGTSTPATLEAEPFTNKITTGELEALVSYTLKVITKMQTNNIKYFFPKQDVTDDFNEHTQSWFKGTVWEEECNAWYKNRKTGRVDAIWPGSALHYRVALEEPRWEDMEIKYHGPNRFQYLGYGYAAVDLSTDPDADRSPYLNADALDPRFYE
ncbi:putative sterigmatocystin biosynthesis monooxygenase stcW [Neonectria ditissima]|uniref:Putative sterigmatocystin biosynthesis monooxygenase stcW n=1 Tax=Neonectria ditissima TaxID=78410 RepID=A0A0P7BMA2_9HYPO|nr:putative sterigmatocystin biosynthesis monooxygenase stcW [Neonectria ditissima]